MHFEWNTFASNWNHGGMSCDVHFDGTYVRIEQTSEAIRVTYELCRGGGGGGLRGLELRPADLHTACLFQVVLTRLFIKARCRLLK